MQCGGGVQDAEALAVGMMDPPVSKAISGEPYCPRGRCGHSILSLSNVGLGTLSHFEPLDHPVTLLDCVPF